VVQAIERCCESIDLRLELFALAPIPSVRRLTLRHGSGRAERERPTPAHLDATIPASVVVSLSMFVETEGIASVARGVPAQ